MTKHLPYHLKESLYPKGLQAVLCSLLLLLGVSANAQNDPVISQYMFNKLAFNPAAAGSREGLSINASYRAQWTGITGAPANMMLNVHGVSANDKYGYGGQIFRDVIGPISQYGFYGDYAYRIHFLGNSLALGIQAGLSYYKTDWASLTAAQQGDAAYTGAEKTTITPNFGFGINFQGKNIDAGISAPHLINNHVNNSVPSFINNNYFINLDYKARVNDKFMIVPATLLKFTAKSAQLDLNLYLVFIQSIWVGAGYRTDKSANFTFQYEFRKNRNSFRIGYSYDLGNGGYRTATSGSHEATLTYELGRRAPLVPPTKQVK